MANPDRVPELHESTARVQAGGRAYPVVFEEHARRHDAHGTAPRDNNVRVAVIHVLADAAMPVLVIVGLLLARAFGWLWMDSLAGIVGACAIGRWSFGLVRDTGAILLDMAPDRRVVDGVRQAVEAGSAAFDLHRRFGPGRTGASSWLSRRRKHGSGRTTTVRCSCASLHCRTSWPRFGTGCRLARSQARDQLAQREGIKERLETCFCGQLKLERSSQ